MPRREAIKVLIVDDSAMVRSILTRVLSQADDITVVAGAANPFEARDQIIDHRPDVIILDIEMPRMNGLTFLKKLVVHYPVPVIMCSGNAPANSRAALEAVEAGAIDVVAKPAGATPSALRRLGEELADKIRAAAVALKPAPVIASARRASPTTFKDAGIDPNRYVVAIGASTGGTEALKVLLAHVPPDFPATVIVQHMPEGFTKPFADRLNDYSQMFVSEAVAGDLLQPGRALLARGGHQMIVKHAGIPWRIEYGSDEPFNRHCPSVDVLFDSVAASAGKLLIGVLLTGMGADGAKGLLTLRERGAGTIAQDKASCVVYGMPKVAVELGAAQHSAAPADIPRLILKICRSPRKSAVAAR